MLSDLFADLINAALLPYFDEIPKKQTNISILKPEIQISNFSIFKFAFLQHGMPLIVEKSNIENLDIQFPSKIQGLNICKGEIKGINIVCRHLLSDTSSYPTNEQILNIKRHQLSSHDIFKSKINNFISKTSAKTFINMFKNLCKDIQLKIQDFHVRIEFGNKEKCTAIGFVFKNLDIGDTPALATEGVIVRGLQLENMSVYLDYNKERVKINNTHNFIEEMIAIERHRHNYLVDRTDFNGLLMYDSKTKKININSTLSTIKINIFNRDLSFFEKVFRGNETFSNFWKCCTLRKPNYEDPYELWNYVNRCANRCNEDDGNGMINSLKYFKAFFKYRRTNHPKIRKDEKPSFDISLPFRTAILYKELSDTTMKKLSHYQDFFLKFDSDVQVFLSDLLKALKFYFVTKEININLKNNHLNGGINFKMNDCVMLIDFIKQKRIFDVVAKRTTLSETVGNENKLITESSKESEPVFKWVLTIPFGNINDLSSNVHLSASEYKINMLHLMEYGVSDNVYKCISAIVSFIRNTHLKLYDNFSITTCATKLKANVNEQTKLEMNVEKAEFSKNIFSINNISAKILFKEELFEFINNFNLVTRFSNDSVELDSSRLDIKLHWEMFSDMSRIFMELFSLFGLPIKIIPHLSSVPSNLVTKSTIPGADANIYFERNSVLSCKLDSIEGFGKANSFNYSFLIKSFSIPEKLDISTINVKSSPESFNISTELAVLRFFPLMSSLPARFFSDIELTLSESPIKFDAKKMILDLSCENAEIIYTSKFSSETKGNSINFWGPSTFTYNNSNVFENEMVQGSFNVDKYFFIKMHYNDANISFPSEVVNSMSRLQYDVGNFPEDMKFFVDLSFDQLCVFSECYLDKVKVQFEFCKDTCFGYMSIKCASIPYFIMQSETLFAMTFDMLHKRYSIAIGDCDIFCDPLKFLEVTNNIGDYPIFIPSNIMVECLMPSVAIHFKLPHEDVSMIFSTNFYVDFTGMKVDGEADDIEIWLNKCNIGNIPKISISSSDKLTFIIKEVLINASVSQISQLANIIVEMSKINIKPPQIVLETPATSISIDVPSAKINLRTQSSNVLGTLVLVVNLNNILFEIFKQRIKCNFNSYATRSAFEYCKAAEGTAVASIDVETSEVIIEMNEEDTILYVSPLLHASVSELFNSSKLSVPFIRITNETGLDLEFEGRIIERETTFFAKNHNFVKEAVFVYNGKEVKIDVRSLKQYYKPFTFAGTNITIGACLSENVLMLSSLLQIKNNSSIQLEYVINNQLFKISPGYIVTVSPLLDKRTFSTMSLINSTKDGCVDKIVLSVNGYPLPVYKPKGHYIPMRCFVQRPRNDAVAKQAIKVSMESTKFIFIDSNSKILLNARINKTRFSVNIDELFLKVSLVTQRLEVSSHEGIIIHTNAAPFINVDIICNKFPTIDDIFVTLGNFDVNIDVRLIWDLFNVFMVNNRHLKTFKNKGEAVAVREKISNKMDTSNIKAVISDRMMKELYVMFIPEQSNIFESIDLLNFKRLTLKIGQCHLTGINKRIRGMPFVVAAIPSFSKITIRNIVFESDSFYNILQSVDIKKCIPVAKKFFMKNEALGYMGKKISKAHLEEEMTKIEKGKKYIALGVSIIESSLEYVSNVMHVYLGDENEFNGEKTLKEVISWGLSSTAISIISGLRLIFVGAKNISEDFWKSLDQIWKGLLRGGISFIDILIVLLNILRRILE